MSAPTFQKRTALILAVICTASLLGLGLLAVFGPEFASTRSGEADVYSMSAIGHGALYDTLEALDIPVSIHRSRRRKPLEGKGVLLILEPHEHLCPGDSVGLGIDELVEESPAALVALPKWQVEVGAGRQPFVTRFAPLQDAAVLAPLKTLGIQASLLRLRVPVEDRPTVNVFEATPRFPSHLRQYLQGGGLEPLVADAHGILLGATTIKGRTVYVLSDPDLLANHGLYRGENASLVLEWLDRLRASGPVVFDETLHGFPPRDQNMLREFFRYPLVLVLLHVLLILALVLWAGMGRFGDAPPPTSGIEPGSGFLIRHTAWLLQFGRHADTALMRYVEFVSRDVSQRYRLPAGLSSIERDARLDAIGAARHTSAPWSQLKREALAVATRHGAKENETVRAARAMHRWKREILDEPGIDS